MDSEKRTEIIEGGERRDAEPADKVSFDDAARFLPAPPIVLPSGEPETDDGAKCEKKGNLLQKIVSGFLSFIFCGTSLTYMIVQTVFSADKLTRENIERASLEEVFPFVGEETEASAAAPDTEQEVTDTESDHAPADEISSYPIVSETLSNTELMSALSNETGYEPDLPSLTDLKAGVGGCKKVYEKYGDDAPAVLIIHTHGTEAFSPDGADTYNENTSFRSENTDENVVAVGNVIENVLRSEGINVIHCTEMFDRESYRESYSRSYAAVASYLKEYPSISYVFDVHRDSVITADMTNVRTLARFEGAECAQTMIVVGTDEGGADHPGWQDNLAFALSLQSELSKDSPTLPRRINLRHAAFNQGLCPGYLLLEIGSCANSLADAKRAAVLTALAICRTLNGKETSLSASDALGLFAP